MNQIIFVGEMGQMLHHCQKKKKTKEKKPKQSMIENTRTHSLSERAPAKKSTGR